VARDPRYDVLFEEVHIGPKVMRNRFFQAAHCLSAGSERPGFQAHFRGMKAEGGWAAVSTEYCSIAPDSDDTHRVSARIWDAGDVRNLALMCDLVHSHGALAAIELWHGGPTAPRQETRVPAIGPSQAVHAFGLGTCCKAMDKADIRRVRETYARAAVDARSAGFDVITLHMTGGGSLPHQFLLPIWNRRTDEYGGSFENRARFATEITEVVREAVGDDCAIAIRFGIDTLDAPEGWGNRGIRADGEGLRFIEHLDHLVDLWDINIAATEWGEDAGPSRTHPENFQRPYVARVKEHTRKPVMNVGRFTSPDTMVELVKSGQLDIIGAARPSIADPFLPKKIEEGRLDDIRECIGCNICISRWEIGGPPLICTQNATSGEEYRRGWHPERFTPARNRDRSVLVIGAGPAGLECAMVLGKRGMEMVHLVDGADEPGGHLRWVSRLPGLAEWRRVIDYRLGQIGKLGNVTLITGRELSPAEVADYGADIVVVATGSRWAADGLNGVSQAPIDGADASLDSVFTPEQICVGGAAPPGERVVVYDCEGYYMGVSLAELLARRGHRVSLVTPFPAPAPYQQYTLEQRRMLELLRELGVDLVPLHLLERVADGAAHIRLVYDHGPPRALACDAVVLATQRVSDTAMYRELKALGAGRPAGVFRIGDCVVPRIVAEGVFDGHRLAREIDSADPRVPLPYLRERRVLASTGIVR
jgi:dimethylamine/trimethylamine dehydrogenase